MMSDESAQAYAEKVFGPQGSAYTLFSVELTGTSRPHTFKRPYRVGLDFGTTRERKGRGDSWEEAFLDAGHPVPEVKRVRIQG